LGIPILTNSSISQTPVRATVAATYTQIENDLMAASHLLPITPLYKTRPSLPATYAMLARMYLSKSDYSHALLYADSSLNLSDSLMNFNNLDTTASWPIMLFNKEVVFHANLILYSEFIPSNFIVDSLLYSSYSPNDLRKSVFFTLNAGYETFRGQYGGSYYYFGGLATDELYLIRAECYARGGDVIDAMADLNSLLVTRWRTGTFVPYTAVNATDALNQILTERRKELICRGVRWTDLRRLNMEPTYSIALTRNLNGFLYTLPPNSIDYTLPIPVQETQVSNIQQNPR
jgi:hypothetical protein